MTPTIHDRAQVLLLNLCDPTDPAAQTDPVEIVETAIWGLLEECCEIVCVWCRKPKEKGPAESYEVNPRVRSWRHGAGYPCAAVHIREHFASEGEEKPR